MIHLTVKNSAVLALLVLSSTVFIRPVSASTVSNSFTVNATVAKACAVAATNINFGTYNPVGGNALAATSTLSITCTNTTSYQVGLNAGASTGATVTTRKMTGQTTSNTLAYGLYQDTNHSINWGNTPGTDTPAAVTANGAAQTATVYGQIAANAAANIDTYQDTITVTVTY